MLHLYFGNSEIVTQSMNYELRQKANPAFHYKDRRET
jgi:hypothetical protein